MMSRKLFVLWREPSADATRHVVGFLEERAGVFQFAYAPSLDVAKAAGFFPFVEFPDETARYSSAYLFPTFDQRIPSPARPDFKRMLSAWGVSRADDKLEILAKSGGFLLTDRIELAEHRAADDALSVPLEFRVAGARHRTPVVALPIGASIRLRAEPDNAADPLAVRVESPTGALAGYVPRQYTPLVGNLIARGDAYEAIVVRAIGEPGTTESRAVIRLARRSPFARV